MTFSLIKWKNNSVKEIIVGIIVCSSQIWIGGGFVSMLGMPDVSAVEYGWLVTTSQIIESIMVIPGIWMSNLLGKKAVLQIAAVPVITAYVLLTQIEHIIDLFLARVLQGFSSGLVNGVLPLYLNEILTEDYRSYFNHLQMSLWYLGAVTVFAIAPYAPVEPVTILLLVLTLVWSLLMFWVPESPWFYFERGREAKALESLSWLRGSQDLARREYDTSLTNRAQASWKDLVSKQVAVISAVAILHWAFVPAWLAYSYETFYLLSGNRHTANGLQLGQAVLCLLASTASQCLIVSSSRRSLLIRSLIIAFLSTIPPSVYLFYFAHIPPSTNLYVSPLIMSLIMFYPIMSSTVFHPVTYLLSKEILYRDKQKKMSTFLALLAGILTSLSCALVPILKHIGLDFVNFSILSGIVFIIMIIIFIVLPETKNKNIFEINRLFRSR